MTWIDDMLKRIGITPNFTQDDVLNAENEDALHTHSALVHELTEAIHRRVAGNEILRHAIDQAKERTRDVPEFERRIRGGFN